jgi:hypothetical protein
MELGFGGSSIKRQRKANTGGNHRLQRPKLLTTNRLANKLN